MNYKTLLENVNQFKVVNPHVLWGGKFQNEVEFQFGVHDYNRALMLYTSGLVGEKIEDVEKITFDTRLVFKGKEVEITGEEEEKQLFLLGLIPRIKGQGLEMLEMKLERCHKCIPDENKSLETYVRETVDFYYEFQKRLSVIRDWSTPE